MLEAKFPLLVSRYAYNVDAGVGAGQYRGGFGLVREYIIESDDVVLHASYGRTATRPWGVDGGAAGSLNGIDVIRGDARRELTAAAALFAAAGGPRCRPHRWWRRLGRPSARDPAAVAQDVRDDLITIADAATCYGVVIDPATWRVDDAATARLREKAHQKARQ